MTAPRRHLTVTDLTALVAAAAAGLGAVAAAAPGRAGPMLIVVAPAIGIALDRRCGGSGVTGGMLGGLGYAGCCLAYLCLPLSGPEGMAMRSSPAGVAIMAGICSGYGLAMGTVARAVGGAMGLLGWRRGPELPGGS